MAYRCDTDLEFLAEIKSEDLNDLVFRRPQCHNLQIKDATHERTRT
ncbi:TPA: DUF3944 domain-containing protein [Neisseria polysaccharea]|nr:DUF3944 domain-containing protein [Neisseria polysaccharea]